MARVSDTEVKKIMNTTIETTPFICTASLIVDEVLSTAGYSEARLKLIELYLSAHLACCTDPRLISETIGKATNNYQIVKGGQGLNSTAYGQQVLLLDSDNILVDIGKPMAKMSVIKADLTRLSVPTRSGR